MISLLTLAGALAAEPAWVEQALQTEMLRSQRELSLPDAPPMYHLRYQALFLHQVSVQASMGDLVSHADAPVSMLGVEVRVGSTALDNTGFGGWQDGFGRTGLPAYPTRDALRVAAWRLTDNAYKEAVEQRARKVAQYTPPPDHPGDYTLTGPTTARTGGAEPTSNPDALVQAARTISGALAAPSLLVGEVHVGHESGTLWVLDSEGTAVSRPVQETTIRAVAALRASDGALLTDHRLWTVRDPSALPSVARMTEEAVALRAELSALAAAPKLPDEYVGPVLFEGSAARDLFRYVLVSQLEGTPPEVPFDSYFGDLGDDRDRARLNRRVLPPGWSATDDPTADPSHPGSFSHDNEGTPAQAVRLIESGIVRNLLMTRVPRPGIGQTNGHARGTLGTRQQGRAAMLDVTPAKARSATQLRRRGLKLARDYGHDYIVVIRRLQEPAVLRHVDGTWFDTESEGSQLPPPVAAIKLYADGREEVFRGAAFASIQRWILRDIVAAGHQTTGSFLAAARGSSASLGPTEGMATFLSAPDVLVGEVELVPAGGRSKPPSLPAPALP